MSPALPSSAHHDAGNVPPLVDLRHAVRQHGKGRRVHFRLQVDAVFAGPEVIGLFGANGAGKSTLMNLIAGNVPADGGEVCVAGRRIDRIRSAERQLLVRHHPQPQLALPQASRAEAMVLALRRWHGAVRDHLADLGRDRAPHGGPQVFLYDEPPLAPPFGGLLFDRFAQLRDEGKLVMFAVHPEAAWHLRLIRGVCDRCAFMQDGQLRLFGSYDAFAADPDVADYLAAVK